MREWIPFRAGEGRGLIPPVHPHDVAAGNFWYTAEPGIYENSCEFERCRQNFFEVRFMVGTHRMVGFHGGLN